MRYAKVPWMNDKKIRVNRVPNYYLLRILVRDIPASTEARSQAYDIAKRRDIITVIKKEKTK